MKSLTNPQGKKNNKKNIKRMRVSVGAFFFVFQNKIVGLRKKKQKKTKQKKHHGLRQQWKILIW